MGISESFGINTEHPHYTSKETFLSSRAAVLGFLEESYNKKLHSQEFYEVNIVLRGSANHYIGQRSITVCAGDTFIIPPNVMHGYDGGAGFDVYHILISQKYLERNAAELQLLPAFSALFRIDPLMRERTSAKLHFRLSEEEISTLSPRLDSLFRYSHTEGAVNAIAAGGEALIIIAELCSMYERHNASPETENEDSAFLSSIACIYERYAEKLTVDSLCRMAQMSRSSYIAKFKRVTGLPPAKFLKQYRVSVAKRLLSETALSEAEIAQAVGCVDTSHLIKLFSSETGVSPSVWRKTSV